MFTSSMDDVKMNPIIIFITLVQHQLTEVEHYRQVKS